jgi:hypothetical protein
MLLSGSQGNYYICNPGAAPTAFSFMSHGAASPQPGGGRDAAFRYRIAAAAACAKEQASRW